MMSFPICGLSSSVRLALVALDSTSEVRSTADSNLGGAESGASNASNNQRVSTRGTEGAT